MQPFALTGPKLLGTAQKPFAKTAGKPSRKGAEKQKKVMASHMLREKRK
jgi:hypothetical protein